MDIVIVTHVANAVKDCFFDDLCYTDYRSLRGVGIETMVIVMKMGEAFGLTHFFLIITIHQTGGPGGYSGDCLEGGHSIVIFFVYLFYLILVGCFSRPCLVKI